MNRRGVAAGLLGAFVLAACSRDPAPVPAAVEPNEPVKLPVEKIQSVDLGRTFDGFMLTVTGNTVTAGWTAPELRPRGTGPTAEGLLEFDFLAQPPTAAAPPAAAGMTRVLAFRPFPLAELQAVRGLRIHAADGPATISFSR